MKFFKATQYMVNTWYNGEVGDLIEVVDISLDENIVYDEFDSEIINYCIGVKCYDFEGDAYDFWINIKDYEDVVIYNLNEEVIDKMIKELMKQKEYGWQDEVSALCNVVSKL